jgi:RNA polymerase sigma factor (sigma-70 family)
VLVENHARFLAFLERRVESREVAEDILQDAFVRSLDGASGLRDQESVTAWFYRLLRNALVDHYRRRGAETRALARVAADTAEDVAAPADEELLRTVCGCVIGLLSTLKPDYATALQRVDLDGVAVQAFAAEAGITPANASVRLHRAREALRKQLVRSCGTCTKHECLDCTCKSETRTTSG